MKYFIPYFSYLKCITYNKIYFSTSITSHLMYLATYFSIHLLVHTSYQYIILTKMSTLFIHFYRLVFRQGVLQYTCLYLYIDDYLYGVTCSTPTLLRTGIFFFKFYQIIRNGGLRFRTLFNHFHFYHSRVMGLDHINNNLL